jgi:hypothetical protein
MFSGVLQVFRTYGASFICMLQKLIVMLHMLQWKAPAAASCSNCWGAAERVQTFPHACAWEAEGAQVVPVRGLTAWTPRGRAKRRRGDRLLIWVGGAGSAWAHEIMWEIESVGASGRLRARIAVLIFTRLIESVVYWTVLELFCKYYLLILLYKTLEELRQMFVRTASL